MRSYRKFLTFLAVPVLLFAVACDSGNDGTDTTVPDVPADVLPDVVPDVPPADVPPADVPPADVPPADIPVEKVTFKGTLIDFQSKAPVEGATVEVLDNVTGLGTGLTTTSGADGLVTFELAKGTKAGFKASMADNKDTYQFNIEADSQDETLWLVSDLTYSVAPALAGLTIDTNKGIVAGGMYFFNDKNSNGVMDEGEEEKVGCATIETTPAGEYRYFNPTSGLPAPLADAPTTSKDLSYFLAGNVAVDASGKIKVVGKVGGTEVGSVDIFSFPNSIAISNIYVTTATNPTPGDCAQ